MEFKKLSDVEVVKAPADNANILIEDNGVIKKVPKTTIGNFIIINTSIEEATCNKTYDEVIKMYCDGTIDCAIMKEINSDTGSFFFAMVYEITLLDADGKNTDAASVECIKFDCGDGMSVYYYANGISWDGPVAPSPM